jgi:hypothetical protein
MHTLVMYFLSWVWWIALLLGSMNFFSKLMLLSWRYLYWGFDMVALGGLIWRRCIQHVLHLLNLWIRFMLQICSQKVFLLATSTVFQYFLPDVRVVGSLIAECYSRHQIMQVWLGFCTCNSNGWGSQPEYALMEWWNLNGPLDGQEG